jgi:hypothetical protein
MTSFKNTGVLFILIFFITTGLKSQKIGGVNFVSPNTKTNFSNFKSLERIAANWIAFNPYAFSKSKEPGVTFNYQHSWWGEQSDGITFMIEQAKREKFKIMLKPHVWVVGEGWCGQYDLKDEKEWKEWEKDYARYILTYAKIAEKYKVEMLCIGTEYKIAATKRELFWRGLIKAIRKIYKGKITYAANWDNYQNIKFWDELDFIGIDAYFPLSQTKDGNTKELNLKWEGIITQLNKFSKENKKKIIFTEFGYKSTNYSTWNQWEIENIRSDEKVNIKAQEIAYSALFSNVWNQSWFSGGFLWKWFPSDEKSGGLKNSDYTPQHKPVEEIIIKYYK